ncbi:DUF6157 family protein [Flammeovirgaceae bacterium SG7u.111]|nr:DUF6157 family protein [Flammeovirgaceae bacterium SG7u.132]WPO33739.1 DUF6157 family protein [Flammeovirgaceae bacterium SG7u.111]
MKIHSTNYSNTFIEVAEDCLVNEGNVPPLKGEKPTVARTQFELLKDAPYQFTSDDVFFRIYAERNDLTEAELTEARAKFFSKGQPCFRSSPLTKRYGWGIHSNSEGKVAMFGRESEEYEAFVQDEATKKVKAMRSKRK